MTKIEPRLYTRQEAAQLLRVSLATFDRLVQNGSIRAAKIGRRVLVSDTAIAEFIDAAESRAPRRVVATTRPDRHRGHLPAHDLTGEVPVSKIPSPVVVVHVP